MFDTAFKKTMSNEGAYSNHPNDRGGETYMGIARNYHPEWSGWDIIDKSFYKDSLKHNYMLKNDVKKFYKEKYWDKLNLDRLSLVLSSTSLELFDIAVNMGVGTAGKFLQRALNILNRDEGAYDDLTVDGLIGSKTIYVVDKYLEGDSEGYILKLLILLKAERYINIAERDKNQEVFIRGWLNRIKL